jgi:hypothetical protein
MIVHPPPVSLWAAHGWVNSFLRSRSSGIELVSPVRAESLTRSPLHPRVRLGISIGEIDCLPSASHDLVDSICKSEEAMWKQM